MNKTQNCTNTKNRNKKNRTNIIDSSNNSSCHLPSISKCAKFIEGGLRLKGIRKSSTKKFPLVTIVTVVYNGCEFLEETIKSVRNQTNNNLEYIIIDGNSSDNTLDIIKKNEHIIDYWVSEPDSGIYDAMNKAWNLIAPESRVLFLGAGDKLLKLPSNNEISRNSGSVLFGDVLLDGNKFKSQLDFRIKLGNTLHHQGLLVPKHLHIKSPFNTDFKIYADYDFNQRLYASGVNFKKTNNLLSYAAPDGVSALLDVKEMTSITKKNFGYSWWLLSIVYCTYQKTKSAIIQSKTIKHLKNTLHKT